MSSSSAAHHARQLLDGKYHLEGEVPTEKMHEYEKDGFKSLVYLCTDKGTDFG